MKNVKITSMKEEKKKNKRNEFKVQTLDIWECVWGKRVVQCLGKEGGGDSAWIQILGNTWPHGSPFPDWGAKSALFTCFPPPRLFYSIFLDVHTIFYVRL